MVQCNGRAVLVDDIIIAYGSNQTMGHMRASQQFEVVVKALVQSGLTLKAHSRLWCSKAWPNPEDPPFVNAVLLMSTKSSAQALLHDLQLIEKDFGRILSERNAPRSVDLDIIYFSDLILNTDSLTIPHKSAHERGFVMGPLSEIYPNWIHPILKKTAFELWKNAKIGADARPMEVENEI